MGQMTFALLYGVEQPEGIDLWGEDGDIGLVSKWEKASRKQVAAFDAAREDKSWRSINGKAEYVPASPYESTIQLLGFYVAVGASGKSGIPDLAGFALGEVDGKYGDAIAAARRRWERFAAWCKEKGHDLPAAKLYLTETEVG